MNITNVKTPFEFELYVKSRDTWDTSKRASEYILDTQKRYSVVIIVAEFGRLTTQVLSNVRIIGNKVHVNEANNIAGCIYSVDLSEKRVTGLNIVTRCQIFEDVTEAEAFCKALNDFAPMSHRVLNESLCNIEHLDNPIVCVTKE